MGQNNKHHFVNDYEMISIYIYILLPVFVILLALLLCYCLFRVLSMEITQYTALK